MTVKRAIYNILRENDFLHEEMDYLDSFTYQVIRAKWTPEDSKYKFDKLLGADGQVLPESEIDKDAYIEHVLEKEHFEGWVDSESRALNDIESKVLLPRIVLVHYTEDDLSIEADDLNNVRPPLNFFSQKGMVINLETSEILHVGTSWINTIDNYDDFKVLAVNVDHSGDGYLQKPIEGASVTLFYCPKVDEIFIGTNRRVLKLSKILIEGAGSRWNFHGKEKFVIHQAALRIFLDVGMNHMGISSFDCGTESELIDLAKMIFKGTFFPSGFENHVYNGIISGKPFANQSRTMSEEDYSEISFTLTSVLKRTLRKETMKTTWEEIDNDRIHNLFEDYSLVMSEFSVELADVMEKKTQESIWGVPILNDQEDILAIRKISANGQRAITKFQTPESVFRERVIRGSSPAEIEEVCKFFPLHRNRKFGTPANIKERVHQVITLSIRGSRIYSFDEVSVLGSVGSIQLSKRIQARIHELVSSELEVSLRHWADVAFPLAEFYVQNIKPMESCLLEHGFSKDVQHRIFMNDSNRRLCNSLAVLYACVSEGLKEAVIDEIARYFISRMMIAVAGFLPVKAIESMEKSYMATLEKEKLPSHVSVPIGVHKLRQIVPDFKLKPSVRKYRLAFSISQLSFLDVRFIMSFINRPYESEFNQKYYGLLTSY